jgi:hypothetical protein
MPALSDKLWRDKDEGKIVFGGCCISDNDPDYKCIDCNALIFKDTGKFIFSIDDEF